MIKITITMPTYSSIFEETTYEQMKGDKRYSLLEKSTRLIKPVLRKKIIIIVLHALIHPAIIRFRMLVS
jgi:hypothetical protein